MTFLTATGFAQGRIGNGGGLTELQFIYFYKNSERFINHCLQTNNPCQISPSTLSDWKKITLNQSEYFQTKIEFVNTSINNLGFEYQDLKLILNRQLIYKNLTTAKENYQVLALAIAIQQFFLNELIDFNTILQNAERALKNLKFEEISNQAFNSQSLLRINQMTVMDSSSKHILISIEDKNKSLDMSELISQKLICGNIHEVQFSNWKSELGRNKVYFHGKATLNCSSEISRFKIRIQADLDSNDLLIPETVKVDFFILD